MQLDSQLIFIVAMVGVFYFIVIRPQQKRVKAQRSMIAALQSGDEILTIGGIYATVVSVDERVRVSLADGSELEVATQAIAQVIPRDASDGELQEDVKDVGSGEVARGSDDTNEAVESQ